MKKYIIADNEIRIAEELNLAELYRETNWDDQEFDNISELKVAEQIVFDKGIIVITRVE